jgi:glycerol-3-phosphate acyltransferase PlsX
MVKIAIDAMGGDFGPEPIVEGVIQALNETDFHALLVGDKNRILSLLPARLKDRVTIIESTDIIDMGDAATDALKRKESSIFKAVDLVRNGEADGVVSAGHSGATMSLATLRIGRLKHVARPAIAALMPTKDSKRSLVLDVGANVDCKADNLFEFAVMGEAYARNVLNVQHPRVGLLSNGEEESKGNEVTKEAFKLLQKLPSFKGNVEGNNIFDGSTDVIVCDGFVGNLVLKTSEGVAETISHFIKGHIKRSPLATAGALLMKKVFKLLKKEIDYAEYGGAPLIGVKGCTIVSHGKSNPKAIKNAIFQAIRYIESGVNSEIEKNLEAIASA